MIFQKGVVRTILREMYIQSLYQFPLLNSAEHFIMINTIFSVQPYFHFLYKVLVFIFCLIYMEVVIIIGVLDLKPHWHLSILNTESGEPGKNQFFNSSIEHFQITRVLFL